MNQPKQERFKTSVGGQALMEGIMMSRLTIEMKKKTLFLHQLRVIIFRIVSMVIIFR